MKTTGFMPLRDTLPYWPDHILGEPEFLDRVGIQKFDISGNLEDEGFEVSGTLVWFREIVMNLSELDGFSVALLSGNGYTAVPFEVEVRPEFAATLPDISLAFRFSTDLLRPVEWEDNRWKELRATDGSMRPAEVVLGGVEVTADLDGNIEFPGQPVLKLGPVQIADTGVVLEIEQVTPYFSRKQELPAAVPPGFRGLTVDSVKVHLPDGFGGDLIPGDLELEGLVIGTGGFSGRIIGRWGDESDGGATYDPDTGAFDGDGAGTLFGIPFALRSLGLEFAQNVPINTSIQGDLLLPFFDEPVAVEVGIGFDGNLTVALAGAEDDEGLLMFEKEGVLRLALESIAFEVEDGVFLVRLSGDVTPLYGAAEGEADGGSVSLNWPTFKVDELIIDSEGNVHLDGGWLDLDEQHILDFYGFQFEITKLGFGTEDDGGKWIGFSGGLKLVNGIQSGASVEGLRVTWYEDERTPGVSFNGIGVELEIPDVLEFKGAVAYRKLPEGGHRFDGAIKLNLDSLDLQVDAMLVIGQAPAADGGTYPFFAIYLGAELPSGIPIFSTGLGLFGMSGLFALQMEPDRRDDHGWYGMDPSKSWYHQGEPGVADLVSKWAPAEGSRAFGAGITLGTFADNGFAFSGRMLFVITFPGPILMIEGRGDLVKKRGESDAEDEPLFRTLIVLDRREDTLTAGLDAEYRYGSGGELLDISGSAEAFFDFNDPYAWYLHVGEKEPREQRIRASLFSLFEANAYFMVDPGRLQMGAWVGYDNEWRFRPVRVRFAAWMDGNAVVSSSPAHFHGSLWLHANIGVSVSRFGAELTADARVEADVFEPFEVLAELNVSMSTPWPLPSVDVDISLQWGPQDEPPPLPVPLKEVTVEHGKVTTTWPLGAGELLRPDVEDGEGMLNLGMVEEDTDAPPNPATVPPDDNIPVIPLDGRVALTFSRPVNDDAEIGSAGDDRWEWVGDPDAGEGPVKVRYGLKKVVLERRTTSVNSWEDVAVAEAGAWGADVGQPVNGDASAAGPKRLLAAWAPAPENGKEAPDGGRTKLLVWARTPFDYFRHTGGAWTDWLSETFPDYPCPVPPREEDLCFDFKHLEIGDRGRLPVGLGHDPRILIGPVYGTMADYWIGESKHKDGADRRTLCVGDDGAFVLFILFAQPVDNIRITLANSGSRPIVALSSEASEGASWEGPFELEGETFVINRKNTRIVAIVVGNGPLCLVEICATFPPTLQQLAHHENQINRLQDQVAEFAGAGHVLEPHTAYRMRVETSVKTEADAGVDPLAGENGGITVRQYAYFRTEGPPGLANISVPRQFQQEQNNGGEAYAPSLQDASVLKNDEGTLVGVDGEPSQYPVLAGALNDLKLFVRQTVPATVPARGEKPVLAQPFYRAYDVGIEFNENYVDLMYRLARRGLHLYLYDRNDKPVRDTEGRLVVLNNRWGRVDEVRLVDADKDWMNTLGQSACVTMDPDEILRNDAVASLQVLEPDTIYEARLTPLLLHDDFTGGLGSWDVVEDEPGSNWSADTNAGYAVESSKSGGGTDDPRDPVKPGSILLIGDQTLLPGHPDHPDAWTNYRLSVYVRLSPGSGQTPGSGAAGLVFRYRNPGGYYRFSLDAKHGVRRLVRISNGKHKVLAEDRTALVGGRDYQITVEAIGHALRVYQDGRLVFNVEDEVLTKGRVGLYSWRNGDTQFAEISVDDFRDRAPVLYRFELGTSQFTNFFHHLHSFQDEIWALELPGTIDRTTSADWWSTDEDVATVDAFGRVTSTRPGEAYIVARLGGAIAAAKLKVTGVELTDLMSLTVALEDEDVASGGTTSASAVFSYDEESHDVSDEVAWFTDDSEIATVDEHGAVAGVAQGVTRLTASLHGLEKSIRVSVDGAEPAPELVSLSVSIGDGAMAPGGTADATVKGDFEDGSSGPVDGAEWNSSDEAVATVDESGQVTAHAVGFALISATVDSKMAATPLMVADPDEDEEEFAVALDEVELEMEGETRAMATVPYPAAALDLTEAVDASVDPPAEPVEVGEAEANAYNALANRPLLEAARGDAPEELQITRVTATDGTVALLLRSPEPVDWTRTSLQILRAAKRPSRTLQAPGQLKLTDIAFGDGDPAGEYVDLLLREPLNIGGYRVEQRMFPGAVVEPGGDPYVLEETFDGRPGGLLFREWFGPNALDRYIIVDQGGALGTSQWVVAQEAITQLGEVYGGDSDPSDPVKPGTLAIVGTTLPENLRIDATLRSNDSGALGIVFRCQEDGRGYRFSMHRDSGAKHRRLVRLNGDGKEAKVLWEDSTQGYQSGVAHHITIFAWKDWLVGYLDSVLLFSVRDSQSEVPERGRVGFYAWNNQGARFEGLTVEEQGGPPVLWEAEAAEIGETVEAEPGAVTPVTSGRWRDVRISARLGAARQYAAILFRVSQRGGTDTPATERDHYRLVIEGPAPLSTVPEPLRRPVRPPLPAPSIRPPTGLPGMPHQPQPDISIGGPPGVGGSSPELPISLPDLVLPELPVLTHVRLIRRSAGEETTLWEGVVPLGQAEHEVTLDSVGGSIRGRIDSEPIFTVEDLALPVGGVALQGEPDPGAAFGHVLVANLTRKVGRFTVTDDDPFDAPSAWIRGGGGLIQDARGLGLQAAPDGGSHAVTGEEDWKDYRVSTELRGDEGRALGLLFRYRDRDNHYRLTLDARKNSRTLTCVADGKETELWSGGGGYDVGRRQKLIVDAVEGTLTGYLDGKRLFRVWDDTHLAGMVGLYARTTGTARFQSLRVSRVPVDARAYLSDAFAFSDKEDWTFEPHGDQGGPPDWEIDGPALRQTGGLHSLPDTAEDLPKRGAAALAGDSAWDDVIVSARVVAQDGAVGLYFRYTDENNHYRFSMNARHGYRRLVKVSAGEYSTLWEDDTGFETDRTYHLEIACIDEMIRGWVNGILAFAVEDEGGPAAGRIGLYCWHSSDARFSEIRVHRPEEVFTGFLFEDRSGEVPAAQGWSVLHTSEDEDGITALVGDSTWADYRVHAVLRVEEGRGGLAVRTRNRDSHYRLTVGADDGVWQLIGQDGDDTKVLAEAERPLAAERHSLVTLACDGDRLAAWVDGVLLFEVEDSAIPVGPVGLYRDAGSVIQYRELRVEPAVWSIYHRFVEEKRLSSGTRLRVYGCRPEHAPTPPDGVEERHAAASGEPGRIRFKSAGPGLRICGPAGARDGKKVSASEPGTARKEDEDPVGHRRAFRPAEDFAVVDGITILRKADGTGLFILQPVSASASLLEAGDYRLKWIYRRDNRTNGNNSTMESGGGGNYDVYSQDGDRSDESVQLDLPW